MCSHDAEQHNLMLLCASSDYRVGVPDLGNLILPIVHLGILAILDTVPHMAIQHLAMAVAISKAVAIENTPLEAQCAVRLLDDRLRPVCKLALINVLLKHTILPAHDLGTPFKHGRIIALGAKTLFLGVGEDVKRLVGRDNDVGRRLGSILCDAEVCEGGKSLAINILSTCTMEELTVFHTLHHGAVCLRLVELFEDALVT